MDVALATYGGVAQHCWTSQQWHTFVQDKHPGGNTLLNTPWSIHATG
jgi:hypothetical protein